MSIRKSYKSLSQQKPQKKVIYQKEVLKAVVVSG